MTNVAGIDVSKAHLDVSVAGGSPQCRANTPEGVAKLLEWLGSQDVLRVVYEPTGGYEMLLAQALRGGGLPAHWAHPNRVRAYAHACGLLAKTYHLDARILGCYGAAFDSLGHPQQEDAPARAELQDLWRRREELVRQRVAERNRLDKGQSSQTAASTQRHIAGLDQEIVQLDPEYQALLSASEVLSRQAALYQSIPGIGLLTAATPAAELAELGRCDGKALAALSGLAPWANDSGGHRGLCRIRGGRGAVRRVLYMAEQSAARHHPTLRAFYQGLCALGEAREAALVAVMRKLLQLNVIARCGAPWVAEYAPAT